MATIGETKDFGVVDPTLREYLEQQLAYERKILDQRIDLFEKTQRVRDEAVASELRTQAIELERRLTELNHAAARATAEAARVVPREIYEQSQKEYQVFVTSTSERLRAIETRTLVWTSAIGLAFLIVGLILRFWPPS